MMSASSLLTTLVTVMSVFERITSPLIGPLTPCSILKSLIEDLSQTLNNIYEQ